MEAGSKLTRVRLASIRGSEPGIGDLIAGQRADGVVADGSPVFECREFTAARRRSTSSSRHTVLRFVARANGQRARRPLENTAPPH